MPTRWRLSQPAASSPSLAALPVGATSAEHFFSAKLRHLHGNKCDGKVRFQKRTLFSSVRHSADAAFWPIDVSVSTGSGASV